MIRSSMRDMLRRILHDTSSASWENDILLNDILNLGLHKVQTKIMTIDPAAFMHIVRGALEANEVFYALPDGFWYELSVGVKSSVSATSYGVLKRGNYDTDRDKITTAAMTYDLRGRFIAFSPAPSFSLSPGYELQFVPTLDMATDDVAPEIHYGLHYAVVLESAAIAMNETEESGSKIIEELKRIYEDLPLYYQRGGEAAQLNIDLGQPVAPSNYPLRNPGVYNR